MDFERQEPDKIHHEYKMRENGVLEKGFRHLSFHLSQYSLMKDILLALFIFKAELFLSVFLPVSLS